MKQVTDPRLVNIITSLEAAKEFIEALEEQSISWHFDDDPTDCLEGLVSEQDAILLGEQRDRLYNFGWGGYECPIGYSLHVFDPENYPAKD